MSKNIFQHVRSGEPLSIPAAAYNAILDAAQAQCNRRITLAAHGNNNQQVLGWINEVQQVERFANKLSNETDVAVNRAAIVRWRNDSSHLLMHGTLFCEPKMSSK